MTILLDRFRLGPCMQSSKASIRLQQLPAPPAAAMTSTAAALTSANMRNTPPVGRCAAGVTAIGGLPDVGATLHVEGGR